MTARTRRAVDAVVVGAGHNGLVAAILLAEAGWDVVVCEASEHVGGAIRSAEVTAPGFTTDLFSAFYPLAAASPVLGALDLERHGLRWSHAPAVLAHVLPDDRAVVLSREVERTQASVAAFCPADAQAWARLVEQWERIGGPLIDVLLSPLPAVAPMQRLLRRLGPRDGLDFLRLGATPVRRAGEEWFGGEGAALLLAGNALHADLSPEGVGSALYGWLLAMLGQSVGFPVPVGGSGRLAEALARRLEAAGGQLRVGARVTGVETSGGRPRAVRLVDDTLLPVRRAVLADVPAPVLYGELLAADQLPNGLRDRLDRFDWDPPTFKLNWALSEPLHWLAEEARGAGTVHLGVDLDGLTDYAADLATGRIPHTPFLLLGQMTTADAHRSPPGTESVWAYTHLPKRAELTPELLDEHAGRIEALIERHAPGFSAQVVGRHVQSPADLQASEPGLVNGAINAGTAQPHQQLIFRPIPGLGGASTPVDGLYLAGASAHPGGGVHGAAGANAARAAMKRETPVLGRARRGLIEQVFKRLY